MLLVREERLVLQYLRQHASCPFGEILKACFPKTPESWGERVVQNLEWLGYLSIFPGSDGQPPSVQLTSRGKEASLNRQ
jgi:hypothetical protein